MVYVRKIGVFAILLLVASLFSCQRLEDQKDNLSRTAGVVSFGASFGGTEIDVFTKAEAVTSLGDIFVSATTGSAGHESASWVSERFKKNSSSKWTNGRVWPYEDPSWHFYASNVMMTHSDDGALVSVDCSKDIVVASLPAPVFEDENTLVFDHILTRLGDVVVLPDGSYTLSDVKVQILPNTQGVYNIRTKVWTDVFHGENVSIANADGSVKENDLYFIPGKYTLSLNWNATDGDGTRSYSNAIEVTFEPGKKSRLELKLRGREIDYLCLSPIEPAVFSLEAPAGATNIAYSLDNGINWVSLDVSAGGTLSTPSVPVGTKVYWKGVTQGQCRFNSTGKYTVTGNPLSIILGDAFEGVTTLPYEGCFNSLFAETPVVNAGGLKLVATVLTPYCYGEMFWNCEDLTVAPELPAVVMARGCYDTMFEGCVNLSVAPALPATVLAEGCYVGMFSSCKSLFEAPELPATELEERCYSGMFTHCSSLYKAPALPATILKADCYRSMFSDCISLHAAPTLPATVLVSNCYYFMFNGCSNLEYIEASFLTTPGPSYTTGWMDGVAPMGTFVKNASATWNVSGSSGVPAGWLVTSL